jgi:hypothetical protein
MPKFICAIISRRSTESTERKIKAMEGDLVARAFRNVHAHLSIQPHDTGAEKVLLLVADEIDEMLKSIKQPLPYAFIQWKGTDVCMDFYCDCGADHHIDGHFVYAVKCHACGAVWEMPSHIIPRKIASHDCTCETRPEENE